MTAVHDDCAVTAAFDDGEVAQHTFLYRAVDAEEGVQYSGYKELMAFAAWDEGA